MPHWLFSGSNSAKLITTLKTHVCEPLPGRRLYSLSHLYSTQESVQWLNKSINPHLYKCIQQRSQCKSEKKLTPRYAAVKCSAVSVQNVLHTVRPVQVSHIHKHTWEGQAASNADIHSSSELCSFLGWAQALKQRTIFLWKIFENWPRIVAFSFF